MSPRRIDSAENAARPAENPTASTPATEPVAGEVILIVQTVMTALILAFMFRAYFIEAFVIPTGSMAPTLLGRHGVQICPQCGWEFDYAPANRGTGGDAAFVPPAELHCPNCHSPIRTKDNALAYSGDRVLVHKWLYDLASLFAPRRWDVIVFHNPADPTENYIKRVVALPGESIEIIDGDVYISDAKSDRFRITRKPASVQSALWSLVYDQGHPPAGETRAPVWREQRENQLPAWSGLKSRVLRCQTGDEREHVLTLDSDESRFYLYDIYGYNAGGGPLTPVGDVRLRANVRFQAPTGELRWEIVRGADTFSLTLDSSGVASVSGPGFGSGPIEVARLARGAPLPIEFGHLDYRVYLKINGRAVFETTDAQYAPPIDELRRTTRTAPPHIRLVGLKTDVELRRLRIDRDVYYTSSPVSVRRAFAGSPFELLDDEFFVLGDNSPNSHDSREWQSRELSPRLREAYEAGEYRVGTVRRSEIVGRAFLVYLPSLRPVDARGRWRMPDIGRIRFIR